MSDTFYLRQLNGGTTKGKRTAMKENKPKRKLKKDWIAEITQVLGEEVAGLDKCTMTTLEKLLEAIKNART